MKLLFVVIAMAMVFQVSLSSPLGRSKRSEQFVKGFENLGSLAKRLIPVTESVVKATIPKIPKTTAYNKYRQELQSYLHDVNVYNTKRGACYQKSFDLIAKYAEIMERFDKPNASAEAKQMETLLKESGGEDLGKNLDLWMEAYEKSNFDIESDNLSSSDSQRLMVLLKEMC